MTKNRRWDRQIGVIVCAYNYGQYLNRSLSSLLNQDFPKEDYFVLAVDDGSSDDTCSVLDRYKHFDNFSFISNDTNQGFGFSINRAMSLIRPKFVLRFDADDVASENLLSELYKHIEEYDFCHPCMNIFYDNDPGKKYLYEVSSLPSFFGSGVLFRYDVISKYQYANMFWEEFDMYLSILEKGARYKILNMPLFEHRIHLQNMTGNRDKFEKGYKELSDKWGNDVLNRHSLTLDRLHQFYDYYFAQHGR